MNGYAVFILPWPSGCGVAMTDKQIEKARQTCRGLATSTLRARRHAITAEIFAIQSNGERSTAAERRLDMLEAAERIANAELRSRKEMQSAD